MKYLKHISLSILAGLLFALPITHAHAQDITSGLVGHWKLDGNANDELGNSNGTLNGDTFFTTGRIFQSADFDGSTDYIAAGSDSSIDNLFQSGATISAWVYAKSRGNNNNGSIYSKHETGGGTIGHRIRFENLGGGNFPLRFRHGFSTTDGAWDTATLSLNQWHHVAITYNCSSTTNDPIIYINGIADSLTETSTPAGTCQNDETEDFTIGARANGSRSWDGYIDDVRMFGRIITAEGAEALAVGANRGYMDFNTTTDTIRYHDGKEWIAAGPPKYKPNAVNFDGAGDRLDYNTPLTGVTDTKMITGSLWMKDNNPGSFKNILRVGGSSNNFNINIGNPDQIRFFAQNTSGTNILDMDTPDGTSDGSWLHILFSFDLSDTNRRHIYINGVDSFDAASIYTDDFLDVTGTGNRVSETIYDFDLADIWMDMNTYIDLSVEANRRAFIDASGNPVDLGSDGSKPTGTAPDIFLSGDTVDWHTNKGTGGGFTETGALTTAPSPREDNYTWQQIGNNSASIGDFESGIAAMTSTRIAYFNDIDSDLQAYDFDGTNWTAVGNSIAIIDDNNAQMESLNSSTVVIASPVGGGELKTYQFDGTDWAQIGNTYSGASNASNIAALDENSIAIGSDSSIRKYTWDGTDWSTVGNAFNDGTGPFDRGDFTALTADRIATVGQIGRLEVYDFDGTDWALVGNSYTIPINRSGVTALNDDTIVVAQPNYLQTFRFNGTDWSPLGENLTTLGGGQPFLTTLKNNTIAHTSVSTDVIKAVGFAHCSTPLKGQGSIIYESANDQMQYCDGENWVPMGPVGNGGAGCASPSGDAGDITYNTTYNLMQYCEGDTWIPIGRSADPCDPTLTPSPGQTCRDGSIYAGLSPDGNVPMYTTSTNEGLFAFNFGNTNYVDTSIIDCPSGPVPGTQQGCFAGEANTNILIAEDSDTSGGIQPHLAAQHCYDLTSLGYTDWYLPARDEMEILYANRVAIENFTTVSTYWTSTENGVNPLGNSFRKDFTSGIIFGGDKQTAYQVRCVRKD